MCYSEQWYNYATCTLTGMATAIFHCTKNPIITHYGN